MVRITLWNTVRWIFGCLFIIGGIGALISGGIIATIMCFLIAGIMIPPVMASIEKKTDVELSGGMKVILIAILYIILLVSMPTISTSPEVNNGDSSSQHMDTTSNYGFGDEVKVGEMVYVVDSAHTAQYIGTDFMGVQADGIFVVVDLTIKNTGSETKHISSSFMKIVDGEGRIFESDEEAWIYYDDNLVFKQLQPGLSTRGKVIFDVPKDATLYLQVSGSFWGTNNKKIKIGRT